MAFLAAPVHVKYIGCSPALGKARGREDRDGAVSATCSRGPQSGMRIVVDSEEQALERGDTSGNLSTAYRDARFKKH